MKCEFWVEQVVFLGRTVLNKGIKVDPEGKINYRVVKLGQCFESRNFLSLVCCYRRFVKEFSKITSYLTNVLRKAIKLECTKKCEKTF